ncbi:MAG: patatin-like phospholipase family protein [Bdellovibrionales bacterium]|nr:patatin-like phospholipase family protein [Bdellovibrionales bacterium]
MNKEEHNFHILSIDGGGIRSIVPAFIINSIFSKLGIDFGEKIQMLAGTSTGSIIVAGLACEISTKKIIKLYSKVCDKILKEIFEERKLGDIENPLLILSIDIGNGNVHIFKSNDSKHFTRDVLVRDAVLASCSTPTYFNSIIEYALGGLWANNPSLVAFIEAQKRLNVSADSIKILSISIGHVKSFYGTDLEKKWGFFWEREKFINFILSLKSQSIHNYLKLIIKEDNLLRLNFESDLPLPLDECTSKQDLLLKADKLFTYEGKNIQFFFNC